MNKINANFQCPIFQMFKVAIYTYKIVFYLYIII